MRKLLYTFLLTSAIWSASFSQVGNDFLRINSKPDQPLSYAQLLNWSKSLKWQNYFVVTGSRKDSLMVVGAIFRDSTTLVNGVKRYYLKYVDYWVDTTRKVNGIRMDTTYKKIWELNHEPDTSKFNFAVDGKISGNMLKYKADYTPVFDSIYVDTLTGDSINVYTLQESTVDTVAFSSLFEDILGNIGINTKFIPFAPPTPDSILFDSTNNKKFYGITAFDSTGKGFMMEFVSTGDTLGGITFTSFKSGIVSSDLGKITFSADTTLNLITPKLKIGNDSIPIVQIDTLINLNKPLTMKDSLFRVDISGNIKKIKGLTYDFPESLGDSVGIDSIKAVLVLTDSTGKLKWDSSLVKKIRKIPDTLRFTRVLRDSIKATLFSKTDTLVAGFKDLSLDSAKFTRTGDSLNLFVYVGDTLLKCSIIDSSHSSFLDDTTWKSSKLGKHYLSDKNSHDFSDAGVLENLLIVKSDTSYYLSSLYDSEYKLLASDGTGMFTFITLPNLTDSLNFVDDTTWKSSKANTSHEHYLIDISDVGTYPGDIIRWNSDHYRFEVEPFPEIDTSWKETKLGKHKLTDTSAHDFSDAGVLENLLIVKPDTSYYLSALYDSEYKLLASDGTGMFTFITLPNLTDSLEFVDDTTWKASKANTLHQHALTDISDQGVYENDFIGWNIEHQRWETKPFLGILDTTDFRTYSNLIYQPKYYGNQYAIAVFDSLGSVASSNMNITSTDFGSTLSTQAGAIQNRYFLYDNGGSLTWLSAALENNLNFYYNTSPGVYSGVVHFESDGKVYGRGANDSLGYFLTSDDLPELTDDTTWKQTKLNVSDTTNFYNLPDNYVTGISSSKSADSVTITLSRNNGLADLTAKFKDSVGTGSGGDTYVHPPGVYGTIYVRDTNNLIQTMTFENGHLVSTSISGGITAKPIDTLVWATKNLDVIFYANGDSIPLVANDSIWATLTTGAYCNYNNSSNYISTYGRLYNWYAVNDPRGLAPSGWHVATESEWESLSNYLGGENIAGGKLKETGTDHWYSPNTGASDSIGFCALPGGARYVKISGFGSKGSAGFWWTATEINSSTAWSRFMSYSNAKLSYYSNEKNKGFSVRCVKNK